MTIMQPKPSVPKSVQEAALKLWQQVEGEHWIPIHGRSMQPLLHDGDAVRVRHGTLPQRRGDLVVFRQGEQLVTHRVLRIHYGAEMIFHTQGDNTWRPDPPVAQTAVLGRVTHLRRSGAVVDLDRRRWRAAGWLLAHYLLLQTAVFHLGRAARRRWLPQNENSRAARLLMQLWRLPRNLLPALLRARRPKDAP